MTQREKRLNAEFRKKLKEEGIIPPDKPRLNRKKFIREAEDAWNSRDGDCLIWDLFLHKALSMMLGHTDKQWKVSLEAVGAAKVLKLAIREKEFHDKLNMEGKTEYSLMEEYEFVKDILDA